MANEPASTILPLNRFLISARTLIWLGNDMRGRNRQAEFVLSERLIHATIVLRCCSLCCLSRTRRFSFFLVCSCTKKAHDTDMQSVVMRERRSLLMKEILDETTMRNSATDEVEKQRYSLRGSGDGQSLA